MKTILAIFLEHGISQPTLYFGENLSLKENFGIPIFGISTLDVKSSYSETRTIQGITDDKEAVIKLYKALKKEKIDVDKPGVGYLCSMVLNYCFGGVNPEIDF
ncbi:MAG: hypothetical protein A2355_12080 [Spirochaetes bacterium RIFOXYB1_FULL_32_8]|nr:MAG: hypothetical protein A2355_12080 [Spirochaetes bacterium RIFOXYB1_FULL_32_8]